MEPIKGNKTDGRDSPKVAIMSHGRGGKLSFAESHANTDSFLQDLGTWALLRLNLRTSPSQWKSTELTSFRDATKQEVFPPLLKGRYSTGRGGEGNIMRNDAGPAVARRAQDVDNYETDNRFTDGDKLVGRGTQTVNYKRHS